MHKFPLLGIVLSIALLFAVLFSGRLIDNRSFTWEQPHAPMQTNLEGSTYLVARNYKQLLDRAQSILLAGEESGNIRYYDSSEDIQADLARACSELTSNTPIGAFAVESIQMTPTQLLSYYNIRVSVSYRRTAEEIASLQPLNSSSELSEILQTALTNLSPALFLSMEYYSPELLNLSKNLTTACRENPDCCYGLAGYQVTTYPDTGLDRIVEIRFTYDATQEESQRRRNAVSAQIEKILAQTDATNPSVALRHFRDQIVGSTKWVSRASSEDDTPYGVFFNQKGTAFGLSATFYQLCRAANLPCYLIVGTYRGEPHSWNMIYVDNHWYHIDLAQECLSPAYYDHFMVSSENMSEYVWSNPNLTH